VARARADGSDPRAGEGMRALFFTTGGDSEPSSRVRVYQYLEPLRRSGIACSVWPLASRRYLELGYGMRRPPAPLRAAWVGGHFAWRAARRTLQLLAARRYDVLVVQKETFPFGLERLIDRLGIPLVYDFDDAIYAASALPDGRGRWLRSAAERVLRRERALPALLARARVVVAGSPVLAAYAERHAREVVVIPTVVDTDAYTPAPLRRAGTLTVGWIGAPPNRVYLEPLRPVLRELARRFDLRLRLVGPSDFDCPGVRVECTGWRHYASVADEVADLHGFDVGIMPLPDTGFAAGKCALKAIQYMACGVPVVASPVGVNAEVVGDGVCGFLADTPAAWSDRLARLLADPDLRVRLGAAGRARAEAHYSLRAATPRLAAALARAAGRGLSPTLDEAGATLRGWEEVVEPSGIEPPTSALRTQRSPS
jgi:glycosyltransferase involved in cell wall biosynthesis